MRQKALSIGALCPPCAIQPAIPTVQPSISPVPYLILDYLIPAMLPFYVFIYTQLSTCLFTLSPEAFTLNLDRTLRLRLKVPAPTLPF